MKAFFIGLGTICILYCLGTFAFGGYGTMFFLIWAVAGVAAIVWGLCGKKILDVMPLWIKRCFLTFVTMCATIFVVVEGMVISGFFATLLPKEGSFLRFLWKKVRGIIFPYIFFTILFYAE